MGKFTNLETHVEPEAALFQQEVDVILAVIDQVLARFNKYPTKGTFILDGQKMGEEAKCIMRFDLAEGSYQTPTGSSDIMTEGAIDLILDSHPCHRDYHRLESNIYSICDNPGTESETECACLVLNTTHGRFLASFHTNLVEVDDESDVLLVSLVEALAQMCKEDTVLRDCANTIIGRYYKKRDDERHRNVIALVQDLFRDCTLPALKAWKEWHEPANDSGELTLFFE